MMLQKLYSRFLLLLVFFTLGATLVQAAEPSFLRESIRARGMGHAFTAVANDEMVLYYNPAALRSVQYNAYEIFNFNVTTNVKASGPLHGSISSDEIDTEEGGFGAIAGKLIYAEFNQGFLSHVNSRFGWSLFSNQLINLGVHNPVFPYFEGRLYNQIGGLAGIGFSFLDYQLDVGVGAKIVNRTGFSGEVHLTDKAIIEATNENYDKAVEEANNLGGSTTAFATDVGVIYHLDGIHNLSPKIAVSVQNIGDLNFENVGKIPMTINTGIATESELQGFDIIMAADYHDLLDGHKLASEGNTFTERNLKLGLEVGWNRIFNGHHVFAFRLGRNGPYNSQGATLNLFGFKMDFAKYSQEVGGYAGEQEDKRWSFQLGLIF